MIFSQEIIDKFVMLQNEADQAQVEVMVWPESALPRNVTEQARYLNYPGLLLRSPYTILGAVVQGKLIDRAKNDFSFYFYNSALFLNREGEILSRIDKSHLVPFGEYVPVPFGPIVETVVPGMGAYRRGANYMPFQMEFDDGRQVRAGGNSML
jgi:apolipoprotein N-acyltransferase